MKTCPQCQQQNADDARFCSNCGYTAPIINNAPSVVPMKNKRNLKTILIVLGCLVGLCALGGILGGIKETASPTPKLATVTATPAPTAAAPLNYKTPPPVVKVTPIVKDAVPAPLLSNENALPPSTRKKRKKQDAVNANDNSLGTNAPASVSSGFESGYHVGPRGGCYTYSASGKKRYVDHSYCR